MSKGMERACWSWPGNYSWYIINEQTLSLPLSYELVFGMNAVKSEQPSCELVALSSS